MTDQIPDLDQIAQVKLPVTDLARSVWWYTRFLGLRVWTEFAEDGVLRGAAMIDPHGRYSIALRDRIVCANTPDLRGFDIIAFRPASRAALDAIAERCDRLGIARGDIIETAAGPRLDVPDPDGTVLRFYHFTGATTGFAGIEFRGGVQVNVYDAPRLTGYH